MGVVTTTLDGTACNNRFDASVLEMSESRGQYTKPTKKKKLDLWTAAAAAAASLSSRVQSPKTDCSRNHSAVQH